MDRRMDFLRMMIRRAKMRRCHRLLSLMVIVGLVLAVVPGLYGQGWAQHPGTDKTGPIPEGVLKVWKAVVHLEMRGKTPSERFPYFSFLGGLVNPEKEGVGRLLNTSVGSGVLIDAKGHILTNAFMIDGASDVRVWVPATGWIKATVLGSDPGTDLSLLKVPEGSSFSFAAPGDSSRVSIGQTVYALGRYERTRLTVTEGIISAKHQKNVIDPVSYTDFIQTDIRMNLSSSGGPLVDTRGKVIGINDALLTRCSGLKGIGFAIPWNTASYVAHQIMSHGKVERGWLGLRVQDVVFRGRGTRRKILEGAMAIEVLPGSPAQKAGVMPGDIIISFNDKAVPDTATLIHLVFGTPIGDVVKLGVLRDGVRRVIAVKIAARPRERKRSLLEERLGIAVTPVHNLHVRMGCVKAGLAITWIDPGSPMERAGFEPEDVIVEANGSPIHTRKDLEQVLSGLKPGDHILFLAIDHRTDRAGYVQVNAR